MTSKHSKQSPLLYRKIATGLIACSLGAFSSGCSDNTNKEQERRVRDQLLANANEKEVHVVNLEGLYTGTLAHFNSEEIETIQLVLIPTTLIVQNPGRNDVTLMPTLGGSLSLQMSADDPKYVLPIAKFSEANFSPDTQHLRLTGKTPSPSYGSVDVTLDAEVVGSQIRGEFSNSTLGRVGFVNLSKAIRPLSPPPASNTPPAAVSNFSLPASGDL